MTKKKKLYIGLAVIIGVLFISGITAIAVSGFGTQSNPLATKSYIDNVASKNILNSLTDTINTKTAELSNKFSKQISSFSGSGSVSSPSSFEVITMKQNQVIRCSVGTEILLRSGSATCYGGSAPRLVNVTDGTTLETAGSALTLNNMYMVSIYNNGLRARSDNTVIMVSGTYTIYDNL